MRHRISVINYHRPQYGQWIPCKIQDTVSGDEIIRRELSGQLETRKLLTNVDLAIVIQPQGCGKSTAIKFINAEQMESDLNRKLLIAIPQTLIAKSFDKIVLQYPDTKQIRWHIRDNLCAGTSKSKIKKVVEFLKRKKFVSGINDRILLCTHAALAIAYDKVNAKDFKNTTVVFDEAHKLKNTTDGTEEENIVSNKLGTLLHDLLQRRKTDKSICAQLWTATFHRGDRLSILTEAEQAKFKVLYTPFDQHWIENLHDLKYFTYDHVIYHDQPFSQVKSILKSSKVPTIIYCPRATHSLSNGDKLGFVMRLKAEIKKVWKSAKILDLVDPSGRDNRKIELFDEKQAENIDIILAIDLMNEGVDWRKAQQAIDLDPSGSLTRHSQRWGRLTRHYPGKKTIHYYSFLRFSTKDITQEEQRENFSKNFTCLISSLSFADAIRPIPIRFAPISNRPGRTSTFTSGYIDWLQQEVPDNSQRDELLQEIAKQLISMRAVKVKLKKKEIRECIVQVLKQNLIRHPERCAIQIALMWKRAHPKYRGDVYYMPGDKFENVWSDEVFDMMNAWGRECGCKDMVELRKKFCRVDDPLSVTHPEIAAEWHPTKNKNMVA